ncbi:uncharacterized protein LOC133195574 [Saccostrea echinata]|uniref:uncharacterized protein LOC133195574 n=1 Tax=Saccostrea echinata TaxID=191078 RepID=UPI002A801921|nr:uncharacterized protein LOC133195574 [Saccostrea echinata]
MMSWDLGLLYLLMFVSCGVGVNEMDKTQYEEGRTQFEVLQRRSQNPKYGKCWTNTVVLLQEGCKHLTDVTQSRLALSYLNCFLEIQGRTTYPCDETVSVRECLLDVTESDRTSLTNFFTHTHSICYFLQSQVWHENTQNTITRLSQASDEVAENLAATTDLQKEALKNQEIIIQQSTNLSNIINSSSENLHAVILDFQKTTDEQRILINDIFDKIVHLQKTMLGEFSGFYSIVYYTVSIVLSYLITSTPRTAAARFWMFGIVTFNIIIERVIIYMFTSGYLEEDNIEEAAYGWHVFCRKVSGCLAMVILVIHAARYRDLNVVNNQLLMDIKSELQLLRYKEKGHNSDEVDHILPGVQEAALTQGPMMTPSLLHSHTSAAADSTEGYESDSAWSSSSDMSEESSYTDVSYHPNLTEAVRGDHSNASTSNCGSSLIGEEEMEFLRNSTPIREGNFQRIEEWRRTGYYTTSRGDASSHPSPSTPGDSKSVQTKYNLRKRTPTQIMNPALREESPRVFRNRIKNLERLAMQNSTAIRERLHEVISDSVYSIEERN